MISFGRAITMNRILWCLTAAFLPAPVAAQPSGLYGYDRSVPFAYQEELVRADSKIEILGAGFQSPKGGKVNMIVVRPRGRGPFAGIIYQHGGPQSMMTY